ncbi:MAG TPA: hypothetical protein VIK84_07165 [Haloplasmataceae bacterium]
MLDKTLYSDFENYIKENNNLIEYLKSNNSILDEYVSPIIKSLSFLVKMAQIEDKITAETELIFQYGFNYLFENLEQIKLYLRQLHNDYKLLDKMSFYIKIVFDLEELKLEINKNESITEKDKQKDINLIDEALEFFEDNIVPDVAINEFELDKYLHLYYDLLDKYSELEFMIDVFNEYCATYGI